MTQTMDQTQDLEQILNRLTTMTSLQSLCVTNNEEENKVCPICKGTFWTTRRDENGYDVATRCQCFAKVQVVRRLKFADLPKAFSGMTLNNFQVDIYKSNQARTSIELVKHAASTYISRYKEMMKTGMGMYFHSKTKGSGKTRLVVSIANELLNKKVSVKFSTSTNILQEIRKSWDNQNGYTESRLLDDLVMTEVLIIDDFGTESVKPWVNEKFYQIINERYVNKRPTIFTSNSSLDDLEYDDRITNRIKERSFPIHFPEESIRNYIAKENTKEMAHMMMEG